MQPATAESSEPASTPSLTCSIRAASPGKGEAADEQAHREADAGDQRHAVELRPADAVRPLRRGRAAPPPQMPPKMPICLPTNSPAAIASTSGSASTLQPDPAQIDAGIGEGEQRHDRERHPRMQRMLEPVERRRVRRAGSGDRTNAVSTPAIVAWMPDCSTSSHSSAPPSR